MLVKHDLCAAKWVKDVNNSSAELLVSSSMNIYYQNLIKMVVKQELRFWCVNDDLMAVNVFFFVSCVCLINKWKVDDDG